MGTLSDIRDQLAYVLRATGRTLESVAAVEGLSPVEVEDALATAEAYTDTGIAAEAATRAAADTATNALVTEIETDLGELVTADAAEATARAAADTTLTTAVSTEASTRAAADATHTSDIAEIEADLAEMVTATAAVATDVAEIEVDLGEMNTATAAVVADVAEIETDLGELASDIATEATARATAVSGEATARAAADTTLTTSISTEVTDRAAADTAHAGASDPHTGYQKESEKDAANGYAGLDAGSKVLLAKLPTGTSSSTVALGDAAAALDATHAAAGDPHTGYRLESADHDHSATGLQGGVLSKTGLVDRTRYIYLYPSDFANDDATRGSAGTTPDLADRWVFADALRQGIYGYFHVPADWTPATAMTVTYIWHPGSAAGSVTRWIANIAELAAGDSTTEDGPETITDITAAASTVLRYDDIATITPSAAGLLVKLNVERAGAAAPDTNASTANLYGVRIAYTADM